MPLAVTDIVSDEAVNFLKSKLIPTATVITPNRSEAEVLADMSIDCESDITTAANRILHDLGPQVVIIKVAILAKMQRIMLSLKMVASVLGQALNMIRYILMVQAVPSPQ